MKNMLKRALSCVLAAVIVCGCMAVSLAEENTGVNEEALDAMEILQMLEIIPEDYYDYNTMMDVEVSRADFVDAVAKIIGVKSYGGSVYYYDVPRTHYAYNSISMLTELGIINGVGSSLFRPEDAIEDQEAYKIILSLMGYNVRAEADGGFPSGYIKTANRLELVYEGSASANMTRGEMFIVLVRAITTEVFEPVVFGKASEYKISETETLLSLYHNVYYREGIVTGAEMITLSGPVLYDSKQASVDGVVYNSEVLLSDSLGEEVEFFVHIERSDDEGTLIWAKETGTTEVLTLDYGDAVAFDKSTYKLSYTDSSDKIKTAAIDRGVTLIYNGRVVDKNIDAVLNLPRYTAKIIRTDGKNKTVIVKAYENYVIGTKDNTSQAVFDVTVPDKTLKLQENLYDYMMIRKDDGTVITYNDIVAGNVVSAFMSLDQKYLEVIVCSDMESGLLVKESTNEEGAVLTVGDKEYILLPETKTDAYSAGDNVTLYLDFTGTAAYLKARSANSFAAYIFDSALENYGFADTLKFRILNQDGSLAVLECAEKVVVDGVKKDKAEDILSPFMKHNEFTATLALIEVTADGKISKIDTPIVNEPYESKASSLSQNITQKTVRYRPFGAFVQEAVIDSNTVLFKVPGEEILDIADDSDYSVIAMGALVNDGQYAIETFNTTDRFGYEEYVVIKHNRLQEYTTLDNPILVTSIGEKLNSREEAVECVEGYQGASRVSFASDGKLSFVNSGIKEGMLITVNKDNRGDVYSLEIVFDPENPKYQKGLYSNRGIDIGYVNDVIGNVMRIGCTSPDVVDRVIQKRAAQVLVYDKSDERNPVYIGSFADAKPYYNVKDECSTVVVVTTYEESNLFVIYNNL